jgi:hypothetical protein
MWYTYIHNGVSFSYKEEWNYVACKQMGGTGEYHVKRSKPG